MSQQGGRSTSINQPPPPHGVSSGVAHPPGDQSSRKESQESGRQVGALQHQAPGGRMFGFSVGAFLFCKKFAVSGLVNAAHSHCLEVPSVRLGPSAEIGQLLPARISGGVLKVKHGMVSRLPTTIFLAPKQRRVLQCGGHGMSHPPRTPVVLDHRKSRTLGRRIGELRDRLDQLSAVAKRPSVGGRCQWVVAVAVRRHAMGLIYLCRPIDPFSTTPN